MIAICQECKQTTEVKPAQDYPELGALLSAWNASQDARGALICETCAGRVAGDLRGETAYILPLDYDDLKQDQNLRKHPKKCPTCGELKVEEIYCTKCGTWVPDEP